MTIDLSDQSQDERVNTGRDKIYQNYLMPNLELYDAKVSINHWQLRDCVKASTSQLGTIYYIYDHSIRQLHTGTNTLPPSQQQQQYLHHNNTNTNTTTNNIPTLKHNTSLSTEVVRFDFKPRCFTETNGLFACGGLITKDDTALESSSLPSSSTHLPQPEPLSLPNSMITNNWQGILSLHNAQTNFSKTFILGQLINNCVSIIPKGNNEFQLFSCNNDSHMYQCNISNSNVKLIQQFSDLKFALNNVAISNDYNTMVVSGDSNEFAVYRRNLISDVFLLTPESNSNLNNTVISSKRIPRFAIPDHHSESIDIHSNNNNNHNHSHNNSINNNILRAPNADHGFYTSFAENNLQFATIFQNGVCLLYDLRKMDTPLTQFNSSRPLSHNGAFRVCKFSKGLDDLLFISEHQGRVHIIDTRNFDNHQVILLPEKLKNDPTPSMTNNSQFRRHSYPQPQKTFEPWVTKARIIPLKYLEPKLIPFPKATTNPYRINNFNQLVNANANANAIPTPKEDSFAFKVRRVSTSIDDPPEIDPSLYNNPTSPNMFENTDFISIDTTPIPSPSRTFQNIVNNYSDNNNIQMDYNYSSSDFTDESNISGLDWIEDENSSSLIIGSHYGVLKWNINSWARRSFSGYDFC
ncbi:hypothetical protein TBLA_0A04180 [Henningerozyma blattae CBS 6284]|uniref:DUF2415 domain-containing protein n=1 Tax=Henningerozyma blattae (strain ATCC 34711 / CBS 6284 / DSM 70876 / NBRC 10599 / NRRL Y-10934 / UCD 77-7) TaxID=1071380 RepID=I2GVR2_HENB6|nr:hypothetical protein TBLA_0A04180 [Tetrapisispora blattae CBS 6284]CCH58214.1 hypothetical protein TBLA_0A04180 [Tetrapisispora blattae CBS 6284]